MDKMTRLAYASWLRCLHESRSHLMQASVLWETCMGQAALCEGRPEDPRHEAYEAMKNADEDCILLDRDEILPALQAAEAAVNEMFIRLKEAGLVKTAHNDEGD